jgi:tetratricopeptide (TPR) repeat protein
LFLTGCSVEKNTGATRFYHGLTSRFNIYFNGYESFREGVNKISFGYMDDFSEMLRVFQNSDPSTVELCSSDMETAIQKASKLISLKSITAKPEFNASRELSENERRLLEQKEFNEWVDDSYFLIGKARFFRHEFSEAASVFSYCIAEANDPEIITESSIWLARIQSENGNYIEAGRLLNGIEMDPKAPRAIRAIYHTTIADLFIKQQKYREAIPPLSNSLNMVTGKRDKYRLTYLLAQLYERTGDPERAISLYRDVVKMNPPYEVEFNAKINIAGVFDVNSGNPEDMIKELSQMLKDSKNKDFQDQIYYVMGNMMKKDGNEKEALDYFRKSASSSSVNQNQKGKSYLAIADHYYSIPDYFNACKYYDSTVYFIEENYPGFRELETKSQNLNLLLTHLTVIQVEDSLQKVAAMTPDERDALISSIIDNITMAENKGITTEYSDRSNLGQYYENERRFADNIAQEGKWYFYNQTALTFGRTEFRRRWGERRHEDNWRRSNKTRVTTVQQASGVQDEKEKVNTDSSEVVLDYKRPEFYIQNLPLNDSLLSLSDSKIAVAYFSAAKVFEDKIDDKGKAAESYEMLIKRFPESDLVAESLYNLYYIYKDENSQKSELSRQRLLEKYPESEFAIIISDPDYYNRKLESSRMIEKIYNEAFKLFDLENFEESIALCDSAIGSFSSDVMIPKFMLLRAYSVARISDERNFKEELKRLIKAWPDTEEGKKASEISAYLNQKRPELKTEEDKVIAAELYEADTTSLYSFVVIISDPAFNINQATFDVIGYNIDNYTNKNYKTEGILIDNKYIKISVTGFSDNSQAWDYYSSFRTETLIRNPSGAHIMTFLITGANMGKLDEDKNPERYYLFFEENYVRGKKNR